jgi:5-aminolevulinate synthase
MYAAIDRRKLVWCSNDYLGMGAASPKLSAPWHAGPGPGGHRRGRHAQHRGYISHHVALEAELADLHGKEAALVFTSGYVSNETGMLRSRLLPGLVIFSDALNHNSMIEGVRQSGARSTSSAIMTSSISRNCCPHFRPQRPKLVAFESIYSMDGDVAPIAEFCDLAETLHAMTYLDEVHAVGMYGLAAAASRSATAS